MISFKPLCEDNIDALTNSLVAGLPEDSMQEVSEIVISLLAMSDAAAEDGYDLSYALTMSHGCLLVRVFDMGRYLFLYPFAVAEDASVQFAILAVAEYARREEIPLVFSDVPAEELSSFVGFRHMDIDSEDAECESYRITVKTECQLLDEIPEEVCGRVNLNAITEADMADYARLCKDEEINKYWGYDYSADVKNPTDDYFLSQAQLDFARGVALSLAIREGECEAFCGEAVIYAFDGRGGAEFAVRLLKEYQGRGLGRAAVLAVQALARKIGLVRLYARVKEENAPSLAMLCGVMPAVDELRDEKYYEITL